MFIVTAICPNCNKTNTHFLGHGKYFRVRDIVDNDYVTYVKKFYKICPDCGEILTFVVAVFKGELMSVNVNPPEDYVEEVTKVPCGTCHLTESEYDYDERKKLLLGADTEIIPYQYSLDSKFKIGDELTFFNRTWRIEESYKIVTKSGNTFSLVFKIKSAEIERLLILKNCSFPELKEPDWSNEEFINEEDKFRRFKIPDGCELVMNLN